MDPEELYLHKTVARLLLTGLLSVLQLLTLYCLWLLSAAAVSLMCGCVMLLLIAKWLTSTAVVLNLFGLQYPLFLVAESKHPPRGSILVYYVIVGEAATR